MERNDFFPIIAIARALSFFLLAALLVEALFADLNGCLFGEGPFLSQLILVGTCTTGTILGIGLALFDSRYRLYHTACLTCYALMLFPELFR